MHHWLLRKTKRTCFTIACLLWLLPILTYGDEKKVSVVYPAVQSAYARVFTDIAGGVGEGFKGRVNQIVLNREDNLEGIRRKIVAQNPDALIALGSSSLKIVTSIKSDVPILAGAIVRNGDLVTGISMIPDAQTVMEILLALKPDIENVYVVDDAKSMSALVNDAKEYLAKRNKTLQVLQADSVHQAAKVYQDILDKIKNGDAIWILPGAPNLDSSVFSLLLEEAWKKQLIVFSSNPSHASRGALFSIYPDNEGMGKSLGKMATDIVDHQKSYDKLIPVQDLFVGVNQRTAKHLGIDIGSIKLGETKRVVFTQ